MRKIGIFCLALWLLLACAVVASAEDLDPDALGSISVTLTERTEKQPIVGAKLQVYYVATVQVNAAGNLVYRYTDAFAACGTAIDDPALAAALDAFVSHNDIAFREMTTNTKGKASCKDLPLGLYFVKQTGEVDGYAPCTPFLVTVPCKDADGYVYDVNATPKTEVAKLVTVTIQKVWNTDATSEIPETVTVELLHGENVVKTAVLHAGNDWRVDYPDMPQSDAYTVREVNVPKGFTPTYIRVGDTFTVTNTATLPQTGQLIWPIPVLTLAGLSLLVLGFVLLQKKRVAHG